MAPDDTLPAARAAFEAGQSARAVDLAWKAVRTAVLAQDNAVLLDAQHLADDIARSSDGDDRRAAEQLGIYCAACIDQPHDVFPFSMKGLFGRRRRRKACPDCAEEIQADARVCRFCGYRYPDAAQYGTPGD